MALTPVIWYPTLGALETPQEGVGPTGASNYQILALQNGSSLAIWVDPAADVIRGQVFASDGKTSAGSFVIASAPTDISTASYDLNRASAAVLDDGTVAIAWQTKLTPNFGSNVTYGVDVVLLTSEGLLFPAGDPRGVVKTVTPVAWNGNPNVYIPSVTATSGGFIVGYNEGATIIDAVYRVDGAGVALQGSTTLTSSGFNLSNTHLANLGGGKSVTVATEAVSSASTGLVVAYLRDASGAVVKITIPGSAAAMSAAASPVAVAKMQNSDDFVISWTEGANVKAQVFTANGAVKSGVIIVGTAGTSVLNAPSVATLEDGGFSIVYANSGSGDVYMAQYTASYSSVFGPTILGKTPSNVQSQPSIVLLEDGRTAVTWIEVRLGVPTTMTQIYDPRITSDSTVGVTLTGLDTRGDGIQGTKLGDTIYGGGGNDTLHGNYGDDQIHAGSGAENYLYGDEGNDTLYGGSGVDYFFGNDAEFGGSWNNGDAISYMDYQSVDGKTGLTINIADSSKSTLDAKNDVYTYASFFIATNYDDIVQGTDARAESLIGGSGHDIISGLAGTDTLIGGQGNDVLQGGADNDTLDGGDGKDVLDGGAGNDSLVGGDGDDTYTIDNLNDKITESSGSASGRDTVVLTGLGWGDSYSIDTHSLNLENLTALDNVGSISLIGNGADNILTGNTSANTLLGGIGNDTLDGGGSGNADSLSGGSGDDVYIVRSAGTTVDETTDGSNGIDTVFLEGSTLGASFTLGANIETLDGSKAVGAIDLTGNDIGNLIIGNGSSNKILGLDGDDTLDGGGAAGGSDTLVGGNGSDTYHLRSSGSTIDESKEPIAGTSDRLIIHEGAIDSQRKFLVSGNFEGIEVFQLDSDLIGGAWVVGHALNSTIYGSSFGDTLDGGGGQDVLYGAAGNDVYIVRSSIVIADESADTNPASGGLDTIIIDGTDFGAGYVMGAGIDTLDASKAASIVELTGNTLDNKITGNGGANILRGGGGKDTLEGGVGADEYHVEADDKIGGESIVDGTVDIAYVTGGFTLDQDVSVEKLQAANPASAVVITGNNLRNEIIGSSGADVLKSGQNTDVTVGDTLDGGAGGDVYYVSNEKDVIKDTGGFDVLLLSSQMAAATDVFTYTVGKDADGKDLEIEIIQVDTTQANHSYAITGNGTKQTIQGGNANDTIDDGGGAGADVLIGGGGDDTYRVHNAGAVISDGTGENKVFTTVSYNLSTQAGSAAIKLFQAQTVAGGTADFELVGNDFDNSIVGASGADTLDGGLKGVDTLEGGEGGDSYIVRRSGITVIENGTTGTDKVRLEGTTFGTAGYKSYVLAANIEILDASAIAGGMKLTGNALANTITGGGGDDTLDGGAAGVFADALIGGSGNDTYYIRNLEDVATELADGGSNDTAYVYAKNYDLTKLAHIENIVFVQGGTDGPDTIDGSDGDDSMDGGGGSDTLNGGGGNDTLDGGAGDDTMDGGTGNDTYHIRDAGDAIVESTDPSGGFDTAIVHIDQFTLQDTVGVEVIQVADDVTFGVTLTGNALTNTITGGAGSDNLRGGGAAAGEKDLLTGGLGDDTYLISSLDDVTLVETGGLANGRDTIRLENSTLTSFTLLDNFEDLIAGVGTGAITLIGNAADNRITGSHWGADTLEGGLGNDTLEGSGNTSPGDNDLLRGGAGDDTYLIRHVGDVIEESTDTLQGTNDVVEVRTTKYRLADDVGIEVLKATAYSNGDANRDGEQDGVHLIGNNYANQKLLGADFADTLDGGSTAVAHTLEGGEGNDVYIIRNAGDKVYDVYGTNDIAYVYTATFGGDVTARQNYETYLRTKGIDDIRVDWVNTAPTGVTLSKLTIHELATYGATVGFLSATDAEDDPITYTLLDGDDGRFGLVGDALSGYRIVVRDSAKLDFEQMPAGGYTIKLQASDGLMDSAVVDFRITLTDVVTESTYGSHNPDLIMGGIGNDQLAGGFGNDTLYGRAGNDILTGGAGHDVFVFDTALNAATNVDVIRDFTVAGDSADRIHLSRAIFGQLSGVVGETVRVEEFCIGTAAADADDRLIYNKATGALYYDENGNAAGGMVQFAQLQPFLALTASHFLLV